MAGGRERGWVVEHFAGLVDPRAERAKRHELLDIIVITICGVICGADNWVEIEEFGNARLGVCLRNNVTKASRSG